MKKLKIEAFDDVVFCIVWIGMFIVSIISALDAHHLSLLKIGTFDFRIPHEYNVNIDGIAFQDVINSIAQTQTDNALAIQRAIANSSKTLRNLNAFAALLSVIGFLMQLNIYRNKQRNRKAEKGEVQDKPPIPEQNVEKTERTGEQDIDPIQGGDASTQRTDLLPNPAYMDKWPSFVHKPKIDPKLYAGLRAAQ